MDWATTAWIAGAIVGFFVVLRFGYAFGFWRGHEKAQDELFDRNKVDKE